MSDRRADPHCPHCHGAGTVIENEQVIDGEYWCSIEDCICVPVQVAPQWMIDRLKASNPELFEAKDAAVRAGV